jgi:hypothetical protein
VTQVLSFNPRIFLYERLLSEGEPAAAVLAALAAAAAAANCCPAPTAAAEECDHLVSKAGPRLSRSGVVDVENPNHESVR